MLIYRLLVLLIIMFNFKVLGVSAAMPLPPVPDSYRMEKIVAVILLKPGVSQAGTVRALVRTPGIKVRESFTAINALSVEGSRNKIEQLKVKSYVDQISESNIYQIELDKSVPFIGGDEVRGMFNEKNERLTGRGVKVGVIDTGADYRHEDLRRSYKGGYDFIDKDSRPLETNGRQATIHGTHVAGIIAANGRIRGVAPEAGLYIYRALGPGGSGSTETVLKAIDRAIQDHVDILNLSLGNSINGPDLPISLAVDEAVRRGITAVVSNGNSGPAMWSVGSPGTSSLAISVGASTPSIKIPYLKAGIGSRGKEMALNPVPGAGKWGPEIRGALVDGGVGRPEELTEAVGKVVLIGRGRLTFADKIKNAEKAGAEAVLLYNNTKGSFSARLNEPARIPAASIPNKDGIYLKSTSSYIKTVYRIEKDRIAPFSSRGPVTTNWMIKPDLVAPGVAITSTIPRGYLALNGTSMAAPHISGACALLKQAHPEWGPLQMKSALMTTARQLETKSHTKYRTYEQGAGRVRIQEAVRADSFFYPSSLTFKKSGHGERSASILVENSSDRLKRYTFLHPRNQPGVVWRVPLPFSLKGGEKKRIKIGLSIDTRKWKTGVYDGTLNITENSRQISLPYLYVINEPRYPRIMSFEFVSGDEKGTYRYQMYLPGGADEAGMVLYEKDSWRFSGYLDWSKRLRPGLITREISPGKLPAPGTYTAVIFAKKAGREDRLVRTITIN
ncbi:S8 family serine peptidase [Peribacillus sp. SCS-37]|uniref:S8 family serine peptidase n=1 Tax=Paraperibacillus esterisolvens TaxID=3115296 RepID=UPI0039059576